MTNEHFAETLRAFQKRRPFKKFIIELTSGTVIEVRHPEAIMFQGKGTAVHSDPGGEITLFDHDGVSRVADKPGKRVA